MRKEFKDKIKKDIILKQLDELDDDRIIEMYEELSGGYYYRDLDELLEEQYTNNPAGAAKAVHFGSVKNWDSDFFTFDGYGNIETKEASEVAEEAKEGLVDEYLDDLEQFDEFDLDEFDELVEASEEMEQKEKKYLDMKQKHEKELNEFVNKYMFYAFSQDQFNEGLKKLNVKQDKIIDAGFGGYVLKSKADEYINLLTRHTNEEEEAQKDPEFLTGELYYEMANHEYGYTRDLTDTLEACMLTFDDIAKDKRKAEALKEAEDLYIKIDDLINW